MTFILKTVTNSCWELSLIKKRKKVKHFSFGGLNLLFEKLNDL